MRRLQHLPRVGRVEVRVVIAQPADEAVEGGGEPLVADVQRGMAVKGSEAGLPVLDRAHGAAQPVVHVHSAPPSGPGRRPDATQLPVPPQRGRDALLARRRLRPPAGTAAGPATMWLVSLPSPSTSTSTTSPGWTGREFAGVPDSSTSPG